tara:strand:+ start:1694 stop:2044 length:351 start_codon:yes stop_codon:yes gene_type:complete
MDTFPTTIVNPSKITETFDYRTLTAAFGDGYEQLSNDGVNVKETMYELNWDILSLASTVVVKTFIDNQTAVKAFIWNNPDTLMPETVRYVKDSLKTERNAVTTSNVTIKFKTAYGF